MGMTQERVKELLDYDPETGLLTWIKARRTIPAGDVGGYIDAYGYRVIKIDGKIYKAHRVAFLYMTGAFPPDQIDHINHNSSDNRWVNLRPVTRKENGKNQRLHKTSTSGISGVWWSKARAKWTAYITAGRKKTNLYYGDDFFEACCVRKSAERKYNYHPNHGAI